jgi:hypothetical protein
LKLTYDELLSNVAFNLNLRHYTKVREVSRATSKLTQDNYPESLAAAYVINAPGIFSVIWQGGLRDSGPCVVKNKPYGSPNGLLYMAQGQRYGIDTTEAFRHIADRIRPRESSFHDWDRPTKTPFFYDTGPESRRY